MEHLPSTPKPQINDIGFSILHDPEDAIADIVFVHGLQGHPRNTWTSKNSSAKQRDSSRESSVSPHRTFKKIFSRSHKDGQKDLHKLGEEEVFWPLDFLPQDCVKARILTWGYDSMVSHFFSGATNQSNINAHARNLLQALKIRRMDCQGRSLIFIAHSLGGIIVKDVLCRAERDEVPEVRDIYNSTAAILFLGTPHRGSNKAGIAEVVRKIVSVSGFDTTDHNIRALQVNSTELEQIHELFMRLYDRKDRNFKVLTFQEAMGVAGVSYLKLNERVVEPFSSSITSTEPIQTINANHMSMCRFTSKDDEGYKQVSGEIQLLLRGVQQKIEQQALQGDKNIAKQTMSPSQTTTASETYSLNDVERRCIAVLTQNTSNAAEYKSSLPHRVEGTCQWILSHAQYRDWNLHEGTCLLWISGYPGSGKTILSAYLLEYLAASEVSPTMRTTICYFFCDEKIDTQRDGLSILRSLIHQLLVRRRLMIKYVKAAYDFYGPKFDQNFNELWRIFIAITSDRRVGSVSVIVDAIDECEQITRDRFLQNILNLLGKSNSTSSRAPSIKFLITSRPLPRRQYTDNFLQIDHNNVEQDLRLFIQTKVEGIVQRTRCKPDVRRYLENALYSKADCTFLWVRLIFVLLEESFFDATQSHFKHIVDEIPKTLKETYERFLQRIPNEYKDLAVRLLHFLVGSSRPLTLDEMQILIATQSHHRSLVDVEEDAQPNVRETIEGVLGPLIRIWDNRIYLVHQSLKEFLLLLAKQPDNPLSTIYGIDLCRANLLLTEVCITYLLLDDFQNDLFSAEEPDNETSPTSQSSPVDVRTSIDDSIGQFWDTLNLEEDVLFKDPAVVEAEACTLIGTKHVFFDYAARYWPEHFSPASSIFTSELQARAILLSDVSRPQGSNWFRYYWINAEIDLNCPRDFNPFLIASYFGHPTSLKTLIQDNSPVEFDVGVRGLYWTARKGHREVAELLLGEGFSHDVKVLDSQSAFIAAVSFDRLDVVKIILEHDEKRLLEEGNSKEKEQDPKESCINHTAMGGRTPLSLAAGNGYLEIAKLLLQHSQIQPDIADFNQWTPLFWAVSGKHLDILNLLASDPCIATTHVDKAGRNVLSWAASSGDLEIVKYLMSLQNLPPNEADRNGRTPLSWAAGNGHLETVTYLRRTQRIDLSTRDKDGRNAISWACSGGHSEVVEYLIKHDKQDADEEDVDGWAPLAWALFSQAPKTVQVLLDSGLVNVNKKDRTGRSVLSFAIGYGYLDVVKLLLDTGKVRVESGDREHATSPEMARLLQ